MLGGKMICLGIIAMSLYEGPWSKQRQAQVLKDLKK